ncbi:hypothetical protein [Janthinobacterium svalbardensis]|uniref:hypothetical protein n=1 Tax=Janthinobacterium svalbardensis TaxID=368607 RepID=UPI00142D4C05|nr:hypothetical protein [Janthinobacterium svalbardensis]
MLIPYKEGRDVGRSKQGALLHRLDISLRAIIHQIKMISTNIMIFMIYLVFSHKEIQVLTDVAACCRHFYCLSGQVFRRVACILMEKLFSLRIYLLYLVNLCGKMECMQIGTRVARPA